MRKLYYQSILLIFLLSSIGCNLHKKGDANEVLPPESFHGINEFIICCGYKGFIIKEYFANYFLHMSDITFDIKENEMKVTYRLFKIFKATVSVGLFFLLRACISIFEIPKFFRRLRTADFISG